MTDHVGRRRFSSAGRAVRRGSVEGTGLPTLAVVALGVLVLGSISPAIAAVGTQTDWSGGAAEPQVVDVWNRSFASSEGISWLAVPGQITLSGVPLETPEKHLVDDDFVRSSSLEPVDLDGDGDLDLLGTALEDDDLDWWRNDGARPSPGRDSS